MIAETSCVNTSWGNGSDYTYTYWYPVTCCSNSYYWKSPEEEATPVNLKKKWWLYLEGFLGRPSFIEKIISHFIPRISLVFRIHHERQYPRVVKGRNNRNP
jgi:hypothetical protein